MNILLIDRWILRFSLQLTGPMFCIQLNNQQYPSYSNMWNSDDSCLQVKVSHFTNLPHDTVNECQQNSSLTPKQKNDSVVM